MNFIVDVLTPFGLHFYSQYDDHDAKGYKKSVNLLNIISVVPVARPFVGALRVWKHIPFVTHQDDRVSIVGIAQIIRGITEFTIYGQWLIVLDVVATVLYAIHYLRRRRLPPPA